MLVYDVAYPRCPSAEGANEGDAAADICSAQIATDCEVKPVVGVLRRWIVSFLCG